MSRMRKPAEERQAEIVETALRLLTHTPVEKLSTGVVAKEVGITQAAIFRHFPTKDALWQAVLEDIERRAVNLWNDAIAKGTSPLERLAELIAAQLGLIAAYPAIPTLIFNAGQISAEDTLRPIHRRVMSGLRYRLLVEIREAAQTGQIPPAPSAEDCADLFLGLVQGTVLRWKLSDRSFDLTQEGRRIATIQIGLLTAHNAGDDK